MYEPKHVNAHLLEYQHLEKQVDLSESEASLVYILSSTCRDPVSKQTNKKPQMKTNKNNNDNKI